MKKKFYLLAVMLAVFVLPGLRAGAQSVTYKPNAAVGEDVDIVTTFGCTPSGSSAPAEFLNWDGYDLDYSAWTISSLGCSNTTGQMLIRFREMNNLPCNAVITKAELRLFGVPTSGFVPQGNSYYPGSPFPTDSGWIERVTSGWTENIVTWSSMPSTTAFHQTPLRNTVSQWNDNFVIDVTLLTQDIWASGNNDGYMLRLQTPSPYRSVVFASSDDPNSALWPELYIEYHTSCNADFTYCSSTPYPNTYEFAAVDPGQCLSYKWDFGDGTSGAGPDISHTYTSPGAYNVCLYMTDAKGNVVCKECTQICISKIVKAPPHGDVPARPAGTGSSNSGKTLVSNEGSSLAVSLGEHFYLADGTLTIMNVSPNPAHTNLDINLRLIKGSNVQYKIYGVDGKEMIRGQKPMNEGAQKLSLPVQDLPTGVYLLEMKDNYSQAKYKFTKE